MKTIHDCPAEIRQSWFPRTQWCKANGIDPKEGSIFDQPIDTTELDARISAKEAADAAKRIAKFNKKQAAKAAPAGFTVVELIRIFVEAANTSPDSASRKNLSRAIDICQQQGGFAAEVATSVERSGRCSEKQAAIIAKAAIKTLNSL